MEHIKNQIAGTLATLTAEQAPATLTMSEKFNFQFETFGEAPLIAAVDSARWLCAEMASDASPRWLSLLGVSGLGKTYLARQIVQQYEAKIQNEIYMKRMYAGMGRVSFPRALFIRWMTIVAKLRNGQYGVIEELATRYHLLAIDDIGAEYESALATAKLHELLDSRIGKWTALTSNKTMAEISTIDRRIASRMIRDRSVVVQLSGMDFNLRPKTK